MRVFSATPLVGTKVVHTWRRPAATAVIALTMLVGAAYVMSPWHGAGEPELGEVRSPKPELGESVPKGRHGREG